MEILGFPHALVASGESRTLHASLPNPCNRITLRGSSSFAVTKLVVGKDIVVYDGAPTQSSIRGDVLVHGIRVYEGPDLHPGMTAAITVINLDNTVRMAEVYLILRKR